MIPTTSFSRSQPLSRSECPDCETPATETSRNAEVLSRRGFLATVGAAVGGLTLGASSEMLRAQTAPAPARPVTASPAPKPESLVKTLHASLSPKQKELICFAADHPKRSMVGANWAIVNTPIGEMTADQQEMVRGILRGLTSEEFYPRLMKQMQDDAAGLTNYHCAIFGDPKTANYEWVITGRHLTLRVDGSNPDNAAFGGPIFYGHAPKDTEDPTHPGNVYWQQGVKANQVYAALDGKQRAIALLDRAPSEDKIKLQGANGNYPGIAIGALARDQKRLVRSVMTSLLAPYRPEAANQVMEALAANGGLDKVHLAFYKQEDLGNDSVWDIWRLEGPAFVWHFRGAPHVHTWVNIANDALKSEAHT